jgi:hypothetical protein
MMMMMMMMMMMIPFLLLAGIALLVDARLAAVGG